MMVGISSGSKTLIFGVLALLLLGAIVIWVRKRFA